MTKNPRYQRDLSVHSPILLDEAYKAPKIRKMLAILEACGALGDAPTGVVVDVGCSGGLFISALAPRCTAAFGIDIDPHALDHAIAVHSASNLLYIKGDSQALPFAGDSVDLLVCNHVYEHVPDAAVLFAEIHRVMRPGSGCCYLGAASRLIPMEPHYHLPLLSWLPRPLADRYMRLTGKGSHYHERLRTWWGLRALLSGFVIEDYTLRVLADPSRFHCRDLMPSGGIWARMPQWVWRLFYPLLPSYLLILRKPGP